MIDLETIELHGHPMSYRRAGSGPALLLLHGITSSSETWRDVLPALAEHHTVVAPDLLGHGASAKPRGDYSLGGFAGGLRDLMVVLGIDSATVVGHSLGGGVAMQLSYQHPERVERLVLVDSGGLGSEVSPLLRAATLPGSDWVLPLLCRPELVGAGAFVGRALSRVGLRPSSDIAGVASGLASLADAQTRRAFLHTARSIMDASGQRVSATERLYLADELPTLIIWGARDPMIPVAHAHAAHELMPSSRLEIFDGAGHFPFHDDPARFVAAVSRFVAQTDPAVVDEQRMRRLIARREAA